MTKTSVLLVDDETLILKAMRRALGRRFEVNAAESAEAALESLSARAFDISIIMTDHDMPRRNGIWLLQQVQVRYPSVRRILMSGRSPPGLEGHVNSGLIQGFVGKPFENDVLLAVVSGELSFPDLD